jgi:mono/diheme cytochrome c family protein
VLKDWRLLPWLSAIAATISAVPAGAQGNIDAGRTPAQLFADTCAACHRSARDVKRASAGFLRQHYMAGSDEASAMANYLSGVATDPRAGQPKRPPASVGDPTLENAKQQAKQQGKQAPQPATTAEQAKSAQGQQKGRRTLATAESRPAAVVDDKVPDLPVAQSSLLSPAAPQHGSPPVILEPFEE